MNNETELFKLDPKIKQMWIDALRSGAYKQGRSCLKNHNDQFCCLGVLADVYMKEIIGQENPQWTDEPSKASDQNADLDKSFKILSYYGSLPRQIEKAINIEKNYCKYDSLNKKLILMNESEFCELAKKNPYLGVDVSNIQTVLAKLNDSGANFDEIADLIEKYL